MPRKKTNTISAENDCTQFLYFMLMLTPCRQLLPLKGPALFRTIKHTQTHTRKKHNEHACCQCCLTTYIYCIGKEWTKHPRLQGGAPCNTLPINYRARAGAIQKRRARHCSRVLHTTPCHAASHTYIIDIRMPLLYICSMVFFGMDRTKHPGLQGNRPAMPYQKYVQYIRVRGCHSCTSPAKLTTTRVPPGAPRNLNT